MLNVIISFIWISIKLVFFCAILPYIFYIRVYDWYVSKRFYEKQPIIWTPSKGFDRSYPIIGHLPLIIKSLIYAHKNNLNNHIIDLMTKIACEDEFAPKVILCYFTGGVGLLISDPSVVEVMYTTKNRFFSKHPLVQELTDCLMGKSILFAETSPEWKKARQTLSPAFYKGKLVNLVEIARESVRFSRDHLKKITQKADGQKARINLIAEFSDIFVRILLMCALGEDISQQQVDYWQNGKRQKQSVSFVLRETFAKLIERIALPSVFFFPIFNNLFLTPHERDIKANATTLRTLIQSIVTRRRQEIAKDPSLKEAGDFLTILLTEDFFMNDNERIIDECFTFFFAGSQTSAVTTQNLIIALMKHPEYQEMLLKEFEDELIKPHFKELIEKGDIKPVEGMTQKDVNILDFITFDSGSNLKLYINCFNEALRMQPPVS